MRKFFALSIFTFIFSITGNAQNNLDSLVWNFGRQLESSFHQEETTFFKDHFVNDVFIKNIFDGFIDGSDIDEYFEKNNSKPDQLINGYLTSLQYIFGQEGDLNLVTYYTDRFNNYYLIFRMDFDGSINYHEFYLDIDKKDVRISDVYMYTSGETFSSTLQRILLPTFAEFDGATISSEDSTLLQAYVVAKQALQFKKRNEGDKARKYFTDNIDFEIIKADKILLLNYVGLYNVDTEPDAYLEALTLFLEKHPNNVTSWLMGIDYYYLNEDYDGCLNVLDSLQTATGDAYLNLYKANAYSMKEDNTNALKYYKQFISDFPLYAESYDSYIYVACIEKENEELLWTAKGLRENLGLNYLTIGNIFKTACPDFYESTMFQEWLPKDDNVYDLKGTFFSNITNSYSIKMKMELNEIGDMIIESAPDAPIKLSKFDGFMDFTQIANGDRIEHTYSNENNLTFGFLVNNDEMLETEEMALSGKTVVMEKGGNQTWKVVNKRKYNKKELEEIKDIVEDLNNAQEAEKEQFSLFPDSCKVGESWDISEANLLKYFRSETKGTDSTVGQMMLTEVIQMDNDSLALVTFDFKIDGHEFEDFKVSSDCECYLQRSLVDFIEKDIACDCKLILDGQEEGTKMQFKLNSSIYMILEMIENKK